MGFFNLFGNKKEKTEPGVFEKIKEAVRQTQENFTERMQDLVVGRKEIDPEMLEELEAIMIGADIGVNTTREILDSIRDQVSRRTLEDPAQLRGAVKAELRKILTVNDAAPRTVSNDGPFVILIVGVNGVGKTTTIGKLANRFRNEGKSVMLCAADTFRAAAIEQLEVWSKRSDVPLIKQKPGADPSAVLYDGLQSAKAKNIDVVIVDTAGRLQTHGNLMEELSKVRRVIAKKLEGAPHETLITIDSTTGQNGLRQAQAFSEAVGLTGVVLTKLDGSAKGGIALAIAGELGTPVKLIGTGESLEDLRPFDPREFAVALLGQ